MGNSAVVRGRFTREIDLAGGLDHPNIAAVYWGGEVDGEPYCVMEYIKGDTLRNYVSTVKSRTETLKLIQKICEAVQHAHARGVLHRDLKPENIMVTLEGEPKLLDFGLARALDGISPSITIEGSFVGTWAYTSPEQARGEIKSITTGSDIYSLGVIFYELLLGCMPYPKLESATGKLKAVAEANIIPPRTVDSSIKDLEKFLLVALADSPKDRYQSAGQMGEDVGRYLKGEEMWVGKTSLGYFFKRWLSRHRLTVTACCLGALAIAVSLTYHWLTLQREKTAAQASLHRFLTASISESMQRGDFGAALPLIDEALRVGHPERDNLKFQRIESLQGLNDPDAVRQVDALQPETLQPHQRPKAYFIQADRLIHSGKTSEGFMLLKRALDLQLPPAEEALAKAAMSSTVSEAIGHHQTAVSLTPWRAESQRNLTLALVLSGRIQEARTQLSMCHLLFPKDGNFYILEGLMEAFQGNAVAAKAAISLVPPDQAEARALFESVIDPIAKLTVNNVRAMQGLPPKTSVLETIGMTFILVNSLNQQRGGNYDTSAMFNAPPILGSGLSSFAKAFRCYMQADLAGAKTELRNAVKICDEGSLWGLLAAIQTSDGEFDAALISAQKAQTFPSLMGGVSDGAAFLEASAASKLWSDSRDPVYLDLAVNAFRRIYTAPGPHDELMHTLPLVVSLRSGNFLLARLVADVMPKDSAAQLTTLAKIGFAEGNLTKALETLEKAKGLFPDDKSLDKMQQQMKEGTLDIPRPDIKDK
jgi:tetratricopeptide (TPR) repeat protein